MYPEFIAIYVMLVIVMALLGVVLFFLLKLMKNGLSQNTNNSYIPTQEVNNQYYAQQYQEQYQVPYQEQYHQQGGSVVFCKQCATQFDSSQGYCPQCGTRR